MWFRANRVEGVSAGARIRIGCIGRLIKCRLHPLGADVPGTRYRAYSQLARDCERSRKDLAHSSLAWTWTTLPKNGDWDLGETIDRSGDDEP